MIVAPNMRILQFIPAGVGFGPIGKKEKMKMKTRKTIDAMLIGSPARPSLNFDGSSGSPRIRLSAMQEMETLMWRGMSATATRNSPDLGYSHV
jgi:hypothetical protein